MQTYKEAEVNCIPYTCRSIAGEDITIGSKIGYDLEMLRNYKKGMILVGYAKNTANKGEFVEYDIDLQR